ncbi:MAG: hypothetical protein OER43_11515 [Gammaproteobacteria bacterium]|nr:hypothetical protein [Gammaproteobacteria bacterium]
MSKKATSRETAEQNEKKGTHLFNQKISTSPFRLFAAPGASKTSRAPESLQLFACQQPVAIGVDPVKCRRRPEMFDKGDALI